MEYPTAAVISTIDTADPEVCATSCDANQSCGGFSIGTVKRPGECKLLSTLPGRTTVDTNNRNTYLKKLVTQGPSVANPDVVPAGGDCWPNKMHYRSSLNATPLNTLKEKCNSDNPPPNTIDYTQLGGDLMPGTNYVKVPGKYATTRIRQNYGSLKTCSSACDDDQFCAGVTMGTGLGEDDENATCVFFDKNTEFVNVNNYNSYKKAYIPKGGPTESPGMIKMTGTTAPGSYTINNSDNMSGTATECKTVCDSNSECGGFIRDATLQDSTAGQCTWKSLADTTPSFDEYPFPFELISEKVIADATKNLWRKQPRKTLITGIDAPQVVYAGDANKVVYNQTAVNGYEIRRLKLPNGSDIATMKGTVDMCAKSCTARAECNSFVHTAGVDDDQIADCILYYGSTNKDSTDGINAWLTDGFFKV